MRKILVIGALLTALTSPTGISPIHAVVYASAPVVKTETKIVTAPLKLTTDSPAAIVAEPAKPDFHVEFTLPARQIAAEIERQKLAAKIEQAQAILAQAGFKTDFAAHYVLAEHKTGTPWQLIAAVHKVETGQRGDTNVASYAGAQGPMQFMPGTWRAYGMDGDGDGVARVHDADDAILSGANYLRANGADKGNYQRALYGYNHAQWYVDKVLRIAQPLGLS